MQCLWDHHKYQLVWLMKRTLSVEQCLPPLFTIHNGLISQSEVLWIKEQILVLFQWVCIVFRELHSTTTVNGAIPIYTGWRTGKCNGGEIGTLKFFCCCPETGLKFLGMRMPAMNVQVKVRQWSEEQLYRFWQFHWFFSKYDFQM